MRRVLRGVAEGEDDLGDVSTLADPSVVDDLKEARSQGCERQSPQNRGGAFQAPPRPLLAQGPSHNIAEHVYPARETIPSKY